MKNDQKEKDQDKSGTQKFREENKDYKETKEAAETGKQGKAAYGHGSTTQGGSNYGQGTSNLGPDSYKQGSEKNEGANYKNEAGKLSQEKDGLPHGQGAHKNEKEANAQEDYPGTHEAGDAEKKDEKKKQGKGL